MLGEIEQNNPVDKYAAPIKKIGKTVGHIPRRKNAKFAYTIFYLADPYGKCRITVTGKAVNLGDYHVMQVPCILFSLTIIFIIFSDFLMFYQIFLSPKVKRCLIITYKHGIYESPHELLNHLRLWILGNLETSRKHLNFIE